MTRSNTTSINPWLLLPGSVRTTLLLAAYHVIIFSIFRVLFYLVFRGASENPLHPVPFFAWYLGFKFDVRLAMLVNLPFLALSWIKWLSYNRGGMVRTIWHVFYALIGTGLFLMYFVDFGHFAYVHSRLNSELLDQMVSLGVALQMVWESYPVIWGLFGLMVLVSSYTWIAKRILSIPFQPVNPAAIRGIRTSVTIVTVLLILFGIYGKFSWYPLRWSDAFYSPDDFTSMVALNPVLYFNDTLPHRTRAFDETAVKKHYALMAKMLQVDNPDPETLNFKRVHHSANPPETPPNIILIHLESFAGFKTGIMGNNLDATPYFDDMARRSVLFTHFFVTRPPTARSIYAALFGVPDIYPHRSVSRNPSLIPQRTLINALTGYQTFYFIGGSATWGNIRGLLHHNIPGLRIYEEGDFTADRVDVWGISDLDLVRKAHDVFSVQQEPFFAFIQTSGNHRPYSIPDDCGNFQVIDLDETTAKDNGFESVKAVNGMRFMDYCIGECIRLASGADYFDNTIFCMYGDHGSPSTADSTYQRLGLTSNHVPMVIYSPRYFPTGQIIDITASSVDLMPTLVGLAGKSYVNSTMGRDLLQTRPPDLHCGFIDNGRRIGVVTDDYFLQLFPGGRTSLHEYRAEHGYDDVSPDHPGITADLKTLCEAMYKCAQYMMYHNRPGPEEIAAGG
ncbi:sulfatase-like hydrolase/transferase [bacterium]|nr:sulfatase-like hydrolase/transferase [candidate division CSSED10-310 bacterium]